MDLDGSESTDAILARYVAGVLPRPAQVLVRSHLEIKSDNRAFVGGLEQLAGDALERIRPIMVGRRKDMLGRIFGSEASLPETEPAQTGGIFPPALRDFIGMDAGDVPWRSKLPGFREYDIGELDGVHATLLWIRPGRRMPAHTHSGSELTLVLDGAFADTRGRYGRGDIAIADETVDHRPVAETERPCISFAVTEGPQRLTGRLHQRLGDILGA
jgi:putative transcriptional regulator